MVADGQVTRGSEVVKPNVRKVRRLGDGKVIGGFAGTCGCESCASVATTTEHALLQEPLQTPSLSLSASRCSWRRTQVMLRCRAGICNTCSQTTDCFVAGQLTRAAVELAKLWRTDKFLRRLDVRVLLVGLEHSSTALSDLYALQATMVVADAEQSLTITGNGDVLEPHDGIVGELS